MENKIFSLMLASTDKHRMSSWLDGLRNVAGSYFITDKLADQIVSIREEVGESKPDVLLLDIDLVLLDEKTDTVNLRIICSGTRTIILAASMSEQLEWELVKAGVRGFSRYDIQPEMLSKVVIAVQQGELWIRRSLTSRLVEELGKTTAKNKAYQATYGLLDSLTHREMEIAMRVSNGERNKEIAYACGITERTVKAHLTDIFLKLGISDRLNLGLIISGYNFESNSFNWDHPIHGQ